MRFRFYSPTEIRFGPGKLEEVGRTAKRYGDRTLLVTGRGRGYQQALEAAREGLEQAGVEVTHYDQVIPNPTVDVVDRGAKIARDSGCQVIVAIGGGSAVDTGKGIAVAATHPGSVWEYMFFQDRQPTEETLPIIAVPTTSGTGSHTTLYAVITNTELQSKSAIANPNIFPRSAIVDPTLMLSMPSRLTACTGFDVFTHAFESYINVSATPMTDLLAMESIRLIAENLPKAIETGEDIEARTNMAWADTLAGICISNAGTTLPHAMGQPISGHFPQVSHGESLAVVYPAFMRYTCHAAPEKFIAVGKVFNPTLSGEGKKAVLGAVETLEEFIRDIGMWLTLEDLGVTEEELEPILGDCMAFPDVQANPRVPDRDETRKLYLERLR